MKDILENYQSAQRDIALGSIPELDMQGNYRWSQGQLEILEKEQYVKLRELNSQIKISAHQREDKLREMVALSNSNSSFDEDLQFKIEELRSEKIAVRKRREQLENQILQKKQDLANRGVYLKTNSTKLKHEVTDTKSPKKLGGDLINGKL